MSQKEIYEFLDKHKGEKFNTTQLHEALPHFGRGALVQNLNRMVGYSLVRWEPISEFVTYKDGARRFLIRRYYWVEKSDRKRRKNQTPLP